MEAAARATGLVQLQEGASDDELEQEGLPLSAWLRQKWAQAAGWIQYVP